MKDHDTNLALAWVVMLPNDIADLATERSEEISDMLIMHQSFQKYFFILEKMNDQSSKLKKSKKKISSLEKQVKLDSDAVKQAKLAPVEQLNKALRELGELEKVARGSVFKRSTAVPEVESVDPPHPYSPFVLPGFNEEEYLKEPVDEDLEKFVEVGNNLSQDAIEANTVAEGGLNADASPVV
ncbi:hypothetical protein Acr_17g0013870 [Actinidia rufa]|uniref:Uncharacterized protein n=1 Tax=Actinidia rufa TaxID=165716 RepID=A0A7J0G4U6_9ERIC|nr:hypothetical protein Acr_17g0013870 [Actinidia rufa]